MAIATRGLLYAKPIPDMGTGHLKTSLTVINFLAILGTPASGLPAVG